MTDSLRMCELQSASELSLSCDAPGAQSAGSIAHGSAPGARRASVLFLTDGFEVTVGRSESATSAAVYRMPLPRSMHSVGSFSCRSLSLSEKMFRPIFGAYIYNGLAWPTISCR